jgi:hypothetical protein
MIMAMMEGVSFVTDSRGKRIAVQLDLDKYGELWEDIYDSITARERAHEPKSTLEEVKARLRRRGKLDDCMLYRS